MSRKIKIERPTEVTPDQFKTIYEKSSTFFDRLPTSAINKNYNIKDTEGRRYKFTRAKQRNVLARDVSYRIVPNQYEKVSKDMLMERIIILEQQIKQMDFLMERIRDLEERFYRYIKNQPLEDNVSKESSQFASSENTQTTN